VVVWGWGDLRRLTRPLRACTGRWSAADIMTEIEIAMAEIHSVEIDDIAVVMVVAVQAMIVRVVDTEIGGIVVGAVIAVIRIGIGVVVVVDMVPFHAGGVHGTVVGIECPC
jgi:hypothetical protein